MTSVVRLGVAGWPVGHSRSPRMHAAALAAAGLGNWRYQALPVPPHLFVDTVRALPALGFRGINVTIPHKEAALALADDATAAARAIGAANTLIFERDAAILADNTDAPGFLEALPRDPRGATAQVLGAGGAARAVVWALLQAGAAEVRVWNRTPARAAALARDLGAVATTSVQSADIIVNCTPVGLQGGSAAFKTLPVRADSLNAGSCVVDMVYRDGGTELLRAAEARGAQVVDGLEILIAQGAASFERWTGRAAPRQAMRDAARSVASQ